jgi:hypothetical protein
MRSFFHAVRRIRGWGRDVSKIRRVVAQGMPLVSVPGRDRSPGQARGPAPALAEARRQGYAQRSIVWACPCVGGGAEVSNIRSIQSFGLPLRWRVRASVCPLA